MIPKVVLSELERWIQEKRYGSLQFHFRAGKIENYSRVDCILVNKKNWTLSAPTSTSTSTSVPKDNKLELVQGEPKPIGDTK